MSKYKYLRVTTGDMMWGKHEMSKEYFVSAVKSGDAIINLEDMTYFNTEENSWQPIQGDKATEGGSDNDE